MENIKSDTNGKSKKDHFTAASASAVRKHTKRTAAAAGRQKCWTFVLMIAMMTASLVQMVHYHHLVFSDTTTTGIDGSRTTTGNNNNKQLFLDPAIWRLKRAKNNTSTASSSAASTLTAEPQPKAAAGEDIAISSSSSSSFNITASSIVATKAETSINIEQPSPKLASNNNTVSASTDLTKDSEFVTKGEQNLQSQQQLHPLLKLLQDAHILPMNITFTVNETNATTTTTTTTTNQELHIGNNNNSNITLPSWSSLQTLYGDLDQPIIIGLETCAMYQQQVPPSQRYTAVAGMFNTGTNAMEFHLRTNIPAVRHTWQVPWGKHRMPFVRLSHVAPGMDQENQQQVLPIVMIRDPFHWMQSMVGCVCSVFCGILCFP